MPLLAAVVDLLVAQITPFFTDAVGGAGSFIFQIIVQLVYGFCFGVAVIAANNVWRGRRATFDEAWEEGRSKAGGILIATIGFYFLVYVAGYIGAFTGSPVVQIVLELVVAFFLIYTIPAAAIGGMPGNLAHSAHRFARCAQACSVPQSSRSSSSCFGSGCPTSSSAKSEPALGSLVTSSYEPRSKRSCWRISRSRSRSSTTTSPLGDTGKRHPDEVTYERWTDVGSRQALCFVELSKQRDRRASIDRFQPA